MKIKILDNSIINKIAAGEVIERPASVVKELLENSLDSGADIIKIEITDSGLKKIKVSDNGCGMDKEDLKVSYKRHATSKLSGVEDLFSIKNLGFRGEALASVAEISNTKIITKTKEKKVGYFIEVEAGLLINSEEMSCPDGTIIEVSDLFFNVPARKKYLKSNDIELSHIIDIVTRYSLINREVSIKLISNNKVLINSQKTDDLLKNITYIYGTDFAKNLVEINHQEKDIIVIGYISKPSYTRSDKKDQSLYINGRYIKDKIVNDAIYNSLRTLLFIGRHPVYVINIIIDNKEVDVNVHPKKTSIRIKDEDKMYEVVYNAIKAGFEKVNLIPQTNLGNLSKQKPIKDYDMSLDDQKTLAVSEIVKPNYKEIRKKDFGEMSNKFGPFRVLGQINKTFILAENREGLSIIDQHAAEERVNYEKFMKEYKNNVIKKQVLLQPKIIELNPMQKRCVENYKEFIENVGFSLENWGENTIKVSAVPEIFGRLKTVLLIDIINELSGIRSKIIDEDIEERIIRMSCRASVKAGDELTLPQMQKLLKDLELCENPYSCPHGRPTIINLTISELEKKFKRTGW